MQSCAIQVSPNHKQHPSEKTKPAPATTESNAFLLVASRACSQTSTAAARPCAVLNRNTVIICCDTIWPPSALRAFRPEGSYPVPDGVMVITYNMLAHSQAHAAPKTVHIHKWWLCQMYCMNKTRLKCLYLYLIQNACLHIGKQMVWKTI